MINSLKILYQSPYNKKNPISAFRRFLIWKGIKLFKIKNYKFKFWGDTEIYINHDSFHAMWLMYYSIVDWEEFNLIKEFVKPGDIVLDIGANMGYYSLWMSKFTGIKGLVIAFEPDNNNFINLEKNIILNNLGNQIVAEKKAVNDESVVISFTINLDGENHIASLNNSQSHRIDSIKLDDYFAEKNIKRIAYLKVDVEGFELNVLKGCSKALRNKTVDLIQLEINETIKNSGAVVNDVLNLLRLNEYTLCEYDVIGNKLMPVNYNSDKENYFATADLEGINLVLSRNKLSDSK